MDSELIESVGIPTKVRAELETLNPTLVVLPSSLQKIPSVSPSLTAPIVAGFTAFDSMYERLNKLNPAASIFDSQGV